MFEHFAPWTYVLLHKPSPIQNSNTPPRPTYSELRGATFNPLPRLYFYKLVWYMYTTSRKTLTNTLRISLYPPVSLSFFFLRSLVF